MLVRVGGGGDGGGLTLMTSFGVVSHPETPWNARPKIN